MSGAPGHTDLMVTPESLDAWLGQNPVPDDRQTAYERARRERREQWWISETEDFCARKEVDPRTGKWLTDQ